MTTKIEYSTGTHRKYGKFMLNDELALKIKVLKFGEDNFAYLSDFGSSFDRTRRSITPFWTDSF